MTTYNITATAGAGGTVTPSGITAVTQGTNQAYLITPGAGYYISSIKIDNVGLTPLVSSYTFTGVVAPHAIEATFAKTVSISTIGLLLTALQAGMTTGLNDVTDYYVKTWFTGDPINMNMESLPAGAVIPMRPKSRVSQYVGEDTITEVYSIKFYQPAYRKQGDPSEVSAGTTRLMAMLDTASAILRADPTFGSTIVNSELRSIDPFIPTAGEANAFRIAEIQIEMKRRALWGQ